MAHSRTAIAVAALAGISCTGQLVGELDRHPPGKGGPADPGKTPGGPRPEPNQPTPTPMPGMRPPAQDACGFAARRVWKLTPRQYGRAVAAVLPAFPDAGAAIASSVVAGQRFTNQANLPAMTEPHVADILASTFKLASAAAAAPAQLAPCLGAVAPDDACLRALVTDYGSKAFRRDLAPAEIDRLAGFVRKKVDAAGVAKGVRQLFLYLLASPQFLYRTELGDPAADAASPTVVLAPFETASALSFFISDGPPDAPLLAAARADRLRTKVQIEEQARRLLAAPESAAGLLAFLHQRFGTDNVREAQKDDVAFPAWTPALADALAAEADAFMRQVLWHEGAKLATFLTADFSMLDGALATFYGAPKGAVPAGATDFRKVVFPPGQRAGFITQGSIMAVKAEADYTSAVRRGLFVREALLCQEVPDPPPDLAKVIVPLKPDRTHVQREQLAVHAANPTCATCHAQMDEIGLAFESYDAIGRYRTIDQDAGKPIDTAGTLTGVTREAPFRDASELMSAVSRTPETWRCLASGAFEYAHGRHPEAGKLDGCALQRLEGAAAGGDLLDLAVRIATDDSFVTRRQF